MEVKIGCLEIEAKYYNNLEKGIFQMPNSKFLTMGITKAFENKNQKKGDKTKLTKYFKGLPISTLGNIQNYSFEHFKSIYKLLDTFPEHLLKVLDQFVERHGFFPEEFLLSEGFDTNYSFNMSNAVFHGPYISSFDYVVE